MTDKKPAGIYSRLNQHPMLIGAIISSIIAGVGWGRLNMIVDDIGDQTDKNEEQQKQIEEDRTDRIFAGIANCVDRNNAWDRAMDYLDTLVQNHEAIATLRTLGIVECPTPPSTSTTIEGN